MLPRDQAVMSMLSDVRSASSISLTQSTLQESNEERMMRAIRLIRLSSMQPQAATDATEHLTFVESLSDPESDSSSLGASAL